MFLLKKIVSRLVFPLPVCLELLCVGIILLWFTRRQKAGKTLVSIGLALLLFLSNGAFSRSLLTPLEHRYPSLNIGPEPNSRNALPAVEYIVVLCGGFTSDPQIPITSQLDDSTIARILEGVILYRELAGAKLILSGGRVYDPVPAAEVMSKVAQRLGVRPQDIILESQSKDTHEEALLIAPVVGTHPFILVTSAWHMPRAMALFKKAGTSPIAAPTDYFTGRSRQFNPESFYPSPDGLRVATRATYEYLGLAWEKLRGQI
jgi:uncharacterized SAM-binding protein YcdF (DUF218 family)